MNVPGRDEVPHARRLRGGRISVPFQTYFLTKCVEDRRPILAAPAAAEIVIESLAFVRAQDRSSFWRSWSCLTITMRSCRFFPVTVTATICRIS